MPAKRRRLHVWESPLLHPNTERKNGHAPVHVVFEDDEFDWWRRGTDGSLEVGWTIERPANPETGAPGTVEWHVFYTVSSGMYAKVNEEWYSDETEDDRGSAALGRARTEPLEEPHEASDLPLRARFSSFGTEGHPDGVPTVQQETIVMPQVESNKVIIEGRDNRLDPITGVNIGAIHAAVNPVSPAPTMLLGPIAEPKNGGSERSQRDLDETRLDLQAPIHNSGK